jgi:putative NIF3 family GTP cyclohydrolase 1 type 2
MTISAQSVVDRIRQKIGSGWKDTPVDAFLAGKPDIAVKGIVTTYAPSLEVLRRAVASGKNMIISRESPYWARDPSQIRPGTGGFGPDTQPAESGVAGGAPPSMEDDPAYRAKRDYIAANNLVVYRFYENWGARQPDPQLQGLAKALGWEKNYKPSLGAQPWATHNGFFEIPSATLKETAQNIKKTLKMKSIRVGGDPNITVSKAALWPGMYWLDDMQRMLAEPGVDLMVVGEPQWENELLLYNFDLHAAGVKKGIIILGQEISEEPGCNEMAAWLKSFVSEVPVEWISAGEPCWMPYQDGRLS